LLFSIVRSLNVNYEFLFVIFDNEFLIDCFYFQVTLAQVYADKEGSIEEEEEDLATPGTSKKRAAPGEGDLFETPKAKRPATSQLTGKSLLSLVSSPRGGMRNSSLNII